MKFIGPILQPLSQEIKNIVLLLHGYGASGHDLISIASVWQPYLPDTLFISPHACESWEMSKQNYQWFSLPNLNPETLKNGVRKALPLLKEYIEEILMHYQIQSNRLAVMGFSQGAMMALAVGLSNSKPFAGILSYSGALIYPEKEIMMTDTPILLVHGDQDDIVPFDYLTKAEKELHSKGVSVSKFICNNTGHGIDYNGLEVGSTFLRQHLKYDANI